jgi:hypothetical protein
VGLLFTVFWFFLPLIAIHLFVNGLILLLP